jgi:hypothetical protein
MRVRSMALAFTALTLLAAAPAMAQAPAPSVPKTSFKTPRTPFGQPDLQGIWTNRTITPLTRPAKFGNRAVLTPAEAYELEEATRQQVARADAPTPPDLKVTDLKNADCGPDGISGFNCGYNQGWKDPGSEVIDFNGEKRSSIIVYPVNGQFPPRKAGAPAPRRMAGNRTDNPETFSLGERCLLSFGSSAGPPMLPLMYNNTYNIVQTPTEVAIQVEMVHDVRTVRLNSKHPPKHITYWMGDSIGWFEGDTLVIETTNFRPEQGLRGGSGNQKVTERLTRIGPDKIHYWWKLEDPDTYAEPVIGEVAFNRLNGMIYEYACHEGNYGLENMLAGARAEEKAGRQVAAVEGAEEGER